MIFEQPAALDAAKVRALLGITRDEKLAGEGVVE
jgi:hypothetical protein